jgi:AcrR family transcriptional regulator
MTKNLTKEERRRQLLDAAVRAFGEKGYHQAQVSDIIKEAGVARGTFYLHFTGKREIFGCIMDELFTRIQHEVRNLPREAVDQIPDQLKGNIERVISLLLDQPLFAKLLFNISVGLDAEQDDRLQRFYGQLLDLIQRGLKQGQEMGFVREGNHHVLAVSLLGCVKEVLYQSLVATEPLDQSTVSEEVFRLVFQGIAHPQLLPELESVIITKRVAK